MPKHWTKMKYTMAAAVFLNFYTNSN